MWVAISDTDAAERDSRHEVARSVMHRQSTLSNTDNDQANTVDNARSCKGAGSNQSFSSRRTYQAQQSVCIENKIRLVGLDVPDDGVHASGLVVAGHNLKVVVDAAQVWLLQLHAYMLGYQINCNHILLPTGHSNAVDCSCLCQQHLEKHLQVV